MKIEEDIIILLNNNAQRPMISTQIKMLNFELNKRTMVATRDGHGPWAVFRGV